MQIFDLEPPAGYDSIASFHDSLRVHLDALHGQSREFFSQTLRGGTRTVEDIFELHHPLRDALKHRIAEATDRYVGAMAESVDHPFLSRRQGAFRFSGSWSSRMRGGGFHVNHIHNGWISSVYYVDVPEVAADAQAHQGWLKFGEPSADLGFGDAVRRLVQPKPGRLVLFPPTELSLARLGESATAAEAVARARATPVIPIMPELIFTEGGVLHRLPPGCGYDVSERRMAPSVARLLRGGR